MPSSPLFSTHVLVLGLCFPNRKFPRRSLIRGPTRPNWYMSGQFLSWYVLSFLFRRPFNGQYEQDARVSDDGGGEWSAGLRIHVPHDSVAQRHYELMYMGRGLGK